MPLDTSFFVSLVYETPANDGTRDYHALDNARTAEIQIKTPDPFILPSSLSEVVIVSDNYPSSSLVIYNAVLMSLPFAA